MLALAGLGCSLALRSPSPTPPPPQTPSPTLPMLRPLAAARGVVAGAIGGGVVGSLVPSGALPLNGVAHGAANGAMAGTLVGGLAGTLMEPIDDWGPTFLSGELGGVAGGASAGALGAALNAHRHAAPAECPITTVDNFDLAAYISAPWYPKWLAPQSYQGASAVNCSSANYALRKGYHDVSVRNTAYDSAAGKMKDSGSTLCADQQKGSKLMVMPCFLPKTFGSPYWVVAYVEDPDATKSYAVVLGGQPDKYEAGKGCRFEAADNNGMWILTRSKTPDQTTMDNVKQMMQDDLNLDISIMNEGFADACPP